jgi:putative FmdB family regulatory protein
VALTGCHDEPLDMPLYEFKCKACGHRFDELVRVGETPPCPRCKDAAPERLFSMSAGISTDRSRKRSAGIARRKAGAIKREKDHAQREYERNYIKEHSEGG